MGEHSSVLGDCLFESKPIPNSADACGEVTGCNAGCQEVNTCSTRGGYQGMCITFTFAKKVNKTELTLALNPREEIQHRGTRVPKKKDMCLLKTCLKNRQQ